MRRNDSKSRPANEDILIPLNNGSASTSSYDSASRRLTKRFTSKSTQYLLTSKLQNRRSKSSLQGSIPTHNSPSKLNKAKAETFSSLIFNRTKPVKKALVKLARPTNVKVKGATEQK